MKKSIAILLSFALVFVLAACFGNKGTESSSTSSPTSESSSASSEAVSTESSSNAKILTIYFSSANTVDATSSATQYFGGTSSTAYIAEYINAKIGGEIAKITPMKDYPESYNDTADAAKAERDSDERPEMQKLSVNPEDYDVIFVGYPMWWYQMPMIMYTFFDTYDFSGKTLIPFNTHEGSGDGGTYDDIKELEPNATVLNGFNVRGGSANNADSDLDEWLAELKY